MRQILTEKDFRKSLMEVAAKQGFQVSWIEAHESAAGVPDLCLSKDDKDIWIELKVVAGRAVKMRPTQRKWHRERSKSGGRSWVFIYRDGLVYVLTGEEASIIESPSSVLWCVGGGVDFNRIDGLIWSLHGQAGGVKMEPYIKRGEGKVRNGHELPER